MKKWLLKSNLLFSISWTWMAELSRYSAIYCIQCERSRALPYARSMVLTNSGSYPMISLGFCNSLVSCCSWATTMMMDCCTFSARWMVPHRPEVPLCHPCQLSGVSILFWSKTAYYLGTITSVLFGCWLQLYCSFYNGSFFSTKSKYSKEQTNYIAILAGLNVSC